MTQSQLIITTALAQVRYLPGSFDKRLGQGLYKLPELTAKQDEWMYRLLYKYRKQMPGIYERYKDNPNCCNPNDRHKTK